MKFLSNCTQKKTLTFEEGELFSQTEINGQVNGLLESTGEKVNTQTTVL